MRYVTDMSTGKKFYFDTTCTVPSQEMIANQNPGEFYLPEYGVPKIVFKDNKYTIEYPEHDKPILAPKNSRTNQYLHPMCIKISEYHKVKEQFEEDMRLI